ncbi:ATP-dependent helicase HrpB [Meinhardsimonia xiamenensis]|jgi:ATP-dependent helicase HrpB|uniref:ATP-dependent helicase HrpB n=1 Tax=Meinhardsimonia xiamenensis TaxID=990712 RepID=A0A1G8ZBW5_9RHOB|nr:ATP-dependent helicase HrpB [Meinhardsimonia xiamenensis]PRX37641.1 ATP-dependent helicase HrpB [Meinhardsimonia xiamenensis]SDK12592.1 ATP-dependent helicase HrpB [Meinhardsimonia xiamenensis]
MSHRLPVEAALPALLAALGREGRAVLEAPPGAGKTTRVPLALLEARAFEGRLVMLEPRRLAARAAAARMAEMLGEPVGRTVGFRIRGETKVSPATRIEVVTEGVLTRMIQSDPALEGVGAVIFDEFHERSLNADLGLALAWEARGALRPDLRLVVMSATLDAAPVAALLDDAPVIRAGGRAFEVETRWLEAPPRPGERVEERVAEAVARAVAETEGGVLVFLPGEGEIRRVAARLDGRLPADCRVLPLYGALPFAQQRAAIAPVREGRKVVLSTSIAETSLTIEDVRVVVDSGLARRARFDPGTGMSRLVTEPVSRAEADQRRGRAGRVAPGVCYRLWARAQEGALPAFAPPEIETADLAPLALELAAWGAGDGAGLAFLTPPPAGPLAAARALLARLGALDAAGRITPHGREMAALPVHPRLAHMLLRAGPDAAPLAALLGERDPLRGAGVDLALRLRALADPARFARQEGLAPDRATLERARGEARRLARLVRGRRPAEPMSPAQAAALAYPDRIGLRRPGEAPRWVLSGGRGAEMDAADPLAGQRLIVATELEGAGREARIRLALPISEAELRAVHGEAIGWVDLCEWSRRERRVVARRQERFGALVLDDRIWRDAPAEAVARAMCAGIRALGLPWTAPARRLAARVALARAGGADLPDLSEEALLADLEEWLLPTLAAQGIDSAEALKRLDITEALKARLGWEALSWLDRELPAEFVSPLGRRLPIDYESGTPEVAARLQEFFGLTEHPRIGPGRVPLKITLLSPAGRPVQTTTDLPGFWAGSYAEVRKEMRGRYPKHPWPEDPIAADPTLRAKARKR